jgi:hypothetical protein
MNNLIHVLTIAFLVSGCTTVKSFERRTEERRESSVITPEMSVLPTLADLEIDQTRSSAAVKDTEPYNTDSMMMDALTALQWQTGADLIIEPRYSVIEKDGLAVVTVTGFPAHYRNLRGLSSEDVELMKKFKTASGKSKKIRTYTQTEIQIARIKRANKAAKSGVVLHLGQVYCEDSSDIECEAGDFELEGAFGAGVSYRRFLGPNFGFSIDAEYAQLSDETEVGPNSKITTTIHHIGAYAMLRGNYIIKNVSLGAGLGWGYSNYLVDVAYDFESEDSRDESASQGGLGRKFTLTAYYPISDSMSLGLEWASLVQGETKQEWKGDINFKPEDNENEPIELRKIAIGLKFNL